MQFLMVVCGLPVTTQVPRIARWMAAGESREAWRFFLRRHLLGLSGMAAGVLLLWLWGDRLLVFARVQSTLLPANALLFMGLIYLLEFNHGHFATLVMTRNTVPFVWLATVSGALIFIGGWIFCPRYGLWGLLGVVFVVQAGAANWWVPWLAWNSVRNRK
jgi:hypothetical protein